MNLTNIRGTIAFWDSFAPWYERWQSRGDYHGPIVGELNGMIEPGWRVLDIGAATGTLAIPLASLGCRVDALEPSGGMREILWDKLTSLDLGDTLTVIGESLESFQPVPGIESDLVLACNSLHLTRGGIREGIWKVFALGARYVALMTEINQSIFIDFKDLNAWQSSYEFLYIRTLSLESSFRFDDREEVAEVEALLDTAIPVLPTEGGGFIQQDRTDLAVVWWERR